MSLQRTCYFCGKSVSFRRRMSLFCSDRCEHLHRTLSGPDARAGVPGTPAPRALERPRDALPPPAAAGGRPRGLWRA